MLRLTASTDSYLIMGEYPGNRPVKYTTIDGKLHTINKCCECPYVDTEYAMCRYPNSRKDIPITNYEGITKGCPLRDEE